MPETNLTLPNLGGYTDAELEELATAVNTERVRRAQLNETPNRLRALFADYTTGGGDPDELAAIAAQIANEYTPDPEPTPDP